MSLKIKFKDEFWTNLKMVIINMTITPISHTYPVKYGVSTTINFNNVNPPRLDSLDGQT